MNRNISIIIPCHNEEGSIKSLVSDIEEQFNNINGKYEIIIVDDFSDKLVSNLFEENSSNINLKIIRHNVNLGQSKAILTGVNNSKYEYIGLMDGDGQNPASELFKLYQNIDNQDIVTGYRRARKDPLIKKIPSKLANILIRFITKTSIRDVGCSLKVMKKEFFQSVSFNGDMHRLIIPILENRGLKVLEMEVEHRPREAGKTHYGLSRIVPVTVDALLFKLTNGFQNSARYALGKLSFYLGTISLVLFFITIYQKIVYQYYVNSNPLFFIALIFLILSFLVLIISILSFFVENSLNRDQE